MQTGMSYGLIEIFLEKTPSLVRFSDASQTTPKTIKSSDIKCFFMNFHGRSRDTPIPLVGQKLAFWTALKD